MKTFLTPLIVLFGLGSPLASSAADPVWLQDKTDPVYTIKVYRSATCGCCKGWNEHLRDHGFRIEDVVVDDVSPYKEQLGVPPKGTSCHTAVVNGKVIEGHVPAQDIKALLASQSDIRLLTVPGMPSGGPGMDWEGASKDAFKVFAMTEDDQVRVFREYADY
jgi:hypothetical protein